MGQVAAFTLRNVERGSAFCHRNPNFTSVFKSELIIIEHDLEVVLIEQDFSGASLIVAVLSNIFITGSQSGKNLASPYFKNLDKYQSSMMFISTWIPSLVNIFGNEQADILAKEGCNASPLISSILTYSEHQFRVKSEILKEWRTSPYHHWFEIKHPGSSFLLKCGRGSQTAISRLKSDHIKSLFLCGGRNTFALCTKCKTQQASPDPILNCLGLSREDIFPLPSRYWIS
ncbi:putative RNA-directed DNA polymerase from transposon BS [Trichonephila clavipes]|nr:putative RNA-directed DNA polymerase from transposon BS [Trichonephila clavipes]